MSPNIKHSNSSAGSHKGSCHGGVHHPKISSQMTSHHGGSTMSHHGESSMTHHIGSHISHHGGSNMSHQGGSHMSHQGGSHMSHQGGSHMSHQGGSHMSHQGGSHMSHQGGSHMSHQGGSHMSLPGGSHMSLPGGHHMSHHGGTHMSQKGDHRMSHHEGHHMPHHGGTHMSHHGGTHMSHHEGTNMSHHGGTHMSQHGGHHMPHHGGTHMSHHGGSHISHHGGHHIPHHGGHNMPHHEVSHMSHHGGSHMSHHEGSHMSHHGGSHMTHNGGSHMSHHGGHHMSHHGGHHMPHHGGHHMSHHGSHHKKEVSFSKHVGHSHDGHFSSSGSHGGWKGDGLFDVNEKQTMQFLNERLSSYLNKVRSLEMENAQLERKICEWYTSNPPKTPPDGTQYFRIIDELQNQIAEAAMENASIVIEKDNARLAADDYRDKYQMVHMLGNNAVMYVNNLARGLQNLNGETCELEMQVQGLQEEMNSLRSNSEEEIENLLTQLGARINVELNAAPSIDLNEALSEIRAEYENLMEKNLWEVENMFVERSQELNYVVASGSEQLQSIETELIEMKRCMQALEIELQSELSLKSALEGTLAETGATFGSKLAELQCLINMMESQLAQVRSDLERQNHEYKILMDQKNHLEMEIATYKRLLEGHDIDVSGLSMSHGKHGSPHSMAHHSFSHHSGGYHSSGHHSGGLLSSGHHSGGLHSSGHHSGGHHSSGHHKC